MKLTLRKITKEDRDFFVKYLNEDINYHKYLHTPFPYHKKDATFWINKCLKEYTKKNPTDYSYIILVDDVPVGGIGFQNLNLKHNNSEIGFWIAKEFRRQGIMQNAIKMICYIGFKQLKLVRIWSAVSGKNLVSQKLMDACGFKLEGKLKKSMKIDNKYEDILIYAIVK